MMIFRQNQELSRKMTISILKDLASILNILKVDEDSVLKPWNQTL